MGAYGGGSPLDTLVIVNVEDIEISKPANSILLQNYPNPFNSETLIKYTVLKTGNTRLTIYDITGQKVRTLVDNKQFSGTYNIKWDGTDDSGNHVSGGYYLYILKAGNTVNSRKMLLFR